MTARTYTDAQRQQAIHLAAQVGPREAGRQLDLPYRTVQSWQRRAVEGAEHLVGAELVAGSSWADRVDRVLPKLGELVEKSLDGAIEKAEAGRGRDAQHLATTMAIAIDKAQLLTGAATSRSEATSLRAEVSPEELAALRARVLPKELDDGR